LYVENRKLSLNFKNFKIHDDPTHKITTVERKLLKIDSKASISSVAESTDRSYDDELTDNSSKLKPLQMV